MRVPGAPQAGLGADAVQRAGGRQPRGAAQPVEARHALPEREGVLQAGGGHVDQEHRRGRDEDAVPHRHELPDGPTALPHGQAALLNDNAGW